MSRLLCGTALALCLALPAQAVVIDLGVNPTSSTGTFSTAAGGDGSGPFEDQVTFELVGGPQFVTIANATNVFPRTTDFITDWEASIYLQVGPIGGADDVLLFGPQDAAPCVTIANCQQVGGTAILGAGTYYAEFTGIGGGTSGYGGNISTFAVPGPTIGGLGSLVKVVASLLH